MLAAQSYKEQTTAEAIGNSNRFLALLAEYEKAPEITRTRLYLEAMEKILPVNGTERCPVFGKIRCPIFCTLKDSNPGGYPEAALPSSSFTATLSIPALRLVLSR